MASNKTTTEKSLLDLLGEQSDDECINQIISDSPYVDPSEPPNTNGKLSIMSLNCQSINAKIDGLRVFVEQCESNQCQLGVICLQETWLNRNNYHSPSLAINGYNFVFADSRISKHGGLGFYIKDDINYKLRQDLIFQSNVFEGFAIEIESKNEKYLIINIYRPPRNIMHNFQDFNSEITSLLCKLQAGRKSRNTIILGDFNTNFLKINENTHIADLLDTFVSSGFLPTITHPSRVNKQSASLLDQIFISHKDNMSKKASIFVSDLSDHMACLLTIENGHGNCNNSKYITIKCEKEENIAQFKAFIDSSNLDEIILDTSHNVTDKYEKLQNILTDGLKQYLPTKMVKYRKSRHTNSPWLLPSLLKSINKKNKLYRDMIRTDASTEAYERKRTNYITFRNLLSKLIKSAKRDYYSNYFITCKSSMVKTWSKINELVKNKNTKSTNDILFHYKDEVITEAKSAANKFNEFFSYIGKNISDNIPPPSCNKTFVSYLEEVNSHFTYNHVTEKDISDTINNLKSKRSCGIDGLSTKILKHVCSGLVPCLTHLINLSFDTGIFPQSLKIAKVIPIFKKNDPTVMDNYRPISLLPAISKVFERSMANQVMQYFEDNHLFYDGQYGFRPNRSTEMATLELVDRIQQDLARNLFPCCIFMDLSKAFDTINHEILLCKLKSYGFDNNALMLFKSYLTNRKQCVSFENETSPLRDITTGVPQGSILGPILFIIYINDLINSCPKLKPVIYADDTTLYFAYKDAKQTEMTINEDLNNVADWLCINKLSLNTSKTKMMVFQKRKDPMSTPNLKISNIEIEKVDEFNFLGITLDRKLNYKAHTMLLQGKLRWSNFVLNRLKNILPLNILRQLYFTLIQSHLNYGILLWGKQCNELIKTQKKSIRIVTTSKYNAHTSPLFKALDVIALPDLYILNVLKFYFKYLNNTLPHYFINFQLTTNHDTHDYNTRWTYTATNINGCHNKLSLRYQLPQIVNSTPSTIIEKVHSHCFDGFVDYCKSWFISNYEIQCQISDCYICKSN